MGDQSKKIKEPYKPGETPRPPQNVHPNAGKQNKEEGQSDKATKDAGIKNTERSGNGHLLSDDAHIDDETTI